ncbi:MAG TPA: hypothetical protein VFU68_05535 [Terracidiphilus sp.]|nr:hypothetical protein [Terracidiphilus sp.]
MGFLQRRVLTLLGIFPWECPLCRRLRYFRTRSCAGEASAAKD